MNFKRIFSILVAVLLMVSMVVLPICAEETEKIDLAVSNGCRSIDGAIPLMGQDRVVQNAKTVILYETNSDTLLYQWNADQKMYPASLVKVMTALLVLEKGDLQDTVTVTEGAIKNIDVYSVSVKLQAGETISVENLLYCLLVHSANDAAAVLAEYVSGSREEFVNLMNSRAQELGCTNTNYTNPHGLHDQNQYTTARDVCRVLQAALEHDTFRTIFGTISYTVPATNLYEKERNLSSNNYLMNENSIYYDDRVTGGRAGETAEGERCIATVSQSGNMEVICVLMGAKTIYTNDGSSIKDHGGYYETATLLDKAFEGYSRRQIITANQILRQQSVTNGDSAVYVAAKDAYSAVLPSGVTLQDLSFQYTDYAGCDQAPISQGQALASLQVWYGTLCIAQTDVYAMNDVPVAYEKIGELKDVEDNDSTWIWIVAAIGLAGILCVVLFLFVKMRTVKRRRRTNNWQVGGSEQDG